MVFSLVEAAEIQKEVESGGGRYINPSKIQGEKRIRLFGEGITGFETWVTEDGKDKPMRWESKPSELPDNVRKDDNGNSQLKRFVSVIAYDYETEDFKVLSLTQKTLIQALMSLIADEDWGDCSGYDIKITRKGEGLKTEYTLKPVSKKVPTKELKDAFAELSCDLSKMFDGEDPFGDSSI
jgi:hypothetical protein